MKHIIKLRKIGDKKGRFKEIEIDLKKIRQCIEDDELVDSKSKIYYLEDQIIYSLNSVLIKYLTQKLSKDVLFVPCFVYKTSK